jgi:hypothetical protein
MDDSPEDAQPEMTVQPREADAAAKRDIDRIKAVCASIISQLDMVDVDLVPVDPFRLRSDKTEAALQTAHVITDARAYLGLVFDEGPKAVRKSREYADTVSQEWAAQEAAKGDVHYG